MQTWADPLLELQTLVFGSFISMPMCQRKQELTVAKGWRTSIFGLIHINTNVSAYRTNFLPINTDAGVPVPLLSTYTPTSICSLYKNTKLSVQIWADRCQGLTKQNGLANSYHRQSVCKHELTPCWGFSNLIFGLIHMNSNVSANWSSPLSRTHETRFWGLCASTPMCQWINLMFFATQYRRRCVSSVAEYSHPYINCRAN